MGRLGCTKTAFGESLFAFLCHEEKELVVKLSVIDLPPTAQYIFSDSVFLADPQFLLETYATLPCSCAVPDEDASPALPVWNGSVLAPCLLQQLAVCLANMLDSGIDETIVRTWGEHFAQAVLVREDGVSLSFLFTRHVLLDSLADTQPEQNAYQLFLECITATLEKNQDERKSYLAFMDAFLGTHSEGEMNRAFRRYQQTGMLLTILGRATLTDLIAFLCILPDEDIVSRGSSLLRTYEYIFAGKNKDFGRGNQDKTVLSYTHMSIAELYYSTGPAQSVHNWVKTYRNLVPAAENYFQRTVEGMESVELHQHITFHLAVGLAISDIFASDTHWDPALELLLNIAEGIAQLSLYLNSVFVSEYRPLFTLTAVRAYTFAREEYGDAAKAIAELLPFLGMTDCLPLLALDLLDCLFANEELKEKLTGNKDILVFAKKALAEAEEYAQHEHWNEQKKYMLQERCAALRRLMLLSEAN